LRSRGCSAASSWPCSSPPSSNARSAPAWQAAALDNIPLYPEFRDCPAPSTQQILEIFALARHQLHRNGALVQTFEPELTTQQLQVLDLLGRAPTAYA
jgi:hypothetical protein